MRIVDIFESRATRSAAGCLILAADTKRLLLARRARTVTQPLTWSVFGGGVEDGETPRQAALRELHEEAGYDGKIKLTPLLTFTRQKGENEFRYYNFLGVVDEKFEPVLNDETEECAWFDFGMWPEPLHVGLRALLSDPPSVNAIHHALTQQTNSPRGKKSAIFPV